MDLSPVLVAPLPRKFAALRCRDPRSCEAGFWPRSERPRWNSCCMPPRQAEFPLLQPFWSAAQAHSSLSGCRAVSGLLGNAGDSSTGHLTCLDSTVWE